MQTPEGKEITIRFLEVLDKLVDTGVLTSRNQFIQMHGLHQPNFLAVIKNPERRGIKIEWLAYINELGGNPMYIITGKGKKTNFTQHLQTHK